LFINSRGISFTSTDPYLITLVHFPLFSDSERLAAWKWKGTFGSAVEPPGFDPPGLRRKVPSLMVTL